MGSPKNDKFVARNLEFRSLRSWFKRLPLIYEIPNRFNNFKCYSYPYENIEENIQKNYKNQSFVSFYKRFILRDVFESWKIYVISKLRKRKTLCEADHIYRRNLKRNILNVLSRNIIRSNKYYKTIMTRRYFELWKKHTKIVQINKSFMERSANFYIRTCLQKSVTNWKAFVLDKKEKAILERKSIEKASKLYKLNLLHKYFIKWINIHNSIKVYKEQLQMVLYYYNKKMLNKYFLAWITYFDMEKEQKDLRFRADQQYCKKLTKRCLKQFILYIDEVYVYKKKLKIASTFHESNVRVKILRAWIQWYYQVKRIHNIMLKVREIVEDKVKRSIFLHLKLYVCHKKCIRRKMSLCLTKYHKRISINALIKMQDYVLYKKRKRTHMLNLSNKTVTIIAWIQSVYIKKWKKALNLHMQEKCKIFRSIEFYDNYISKRYLFFWKKFSQQYKIKLLLQKELNERATRIVLNTFVMLWKRRYKESYKIYEKEKLLVSIIHRKIQKKYFICWEIYKNKKIEKRKDIEHAKGMNKKFFLQEGLREIIRYSLFSKQFDHENRLKYAISRSAEEFEMLSRYFAKWLSIIYLKEKSESSILGRTSCCSYRDNVISSQYTISKYDGLNTFIVNDTNNNLYFTASCNSESISSLTNNVKLLPPSAFY